MKKKTKKGKQIRDKRIGETKKGRHFRIEKRNYVEKIECEKNYYRKKMEMRTKRRTNRTNEGQNTRNEHILP